MSDDIPEAPPGLESGRMFFKKARIPTIRDASQDKHRSELLAHEMMQMMQDLFFVKIQEQSFVSLLCSELRKDLQTCLSDALEGTAMENRQQRVQLEAMLKWVSEESCHLWPMYRMTRWKHPDIVEALENSRLDESGKSVLNLEALKAMETTTTVRNDQESDRQRHNESDRPSTSNRGHADPFEEDEKRLFGPDAPLNSASKMPSSVAFQPPPHVPVHTKREIDPPNPVKLNVRSLEWYGNAFGDRVDHLLPDTITEREWKGRDNYEAELSDFERELLDDKNRESWLAACEPCMQKMERFLGCPLSTFMALTTKMSTRPCSHTIARYRKPFFLYPRKSYRQYIWKQHMHCVEKGLRKTRIKSE